MVGILQENENYSRASKRRKETFKASGSVEVPQEAFPGDLKGGGIVANKNKNEPKVLVSRVPVCCRYRYCIVYSVAL